VAQRFRSQEILSLRVRSSVALLRHTLCEIPGDENMKRFFKEYQFIISVILAIIGIIGLDALVSFINRTVQIIPWLNAFLNHYSGVLLLTLILISFYLAHKQSMLSRKLGMLSPETLTVVSNEETIFIGSNTHRALPSNVKAVATQIHPLWKEADRKYPELRTATWIADRKNITNDEAIHGGQYTFVREFEMPFDLSRMRSTEIYLLVDDFCEVIVNETRFEKVEGFQDIHNFDISRAVQKGTNRVQFVVENRDAHAENDPNVNKGFYESKEKFLWNPYGFKFCIVIQYFG
jgi:hypothetical protein